MPTSLLEFASYSNLKVANTFGPHNPGGDYYNQMAQPRRRLLQSDGTTKEETTTIRWHNQGGDYYNQMAQPRRRLLQSDGTTKEETTTIRWHNQGGDYYNQMAQPRRRLLQSDGTTQEETTTIRWHNPGGDYYNQNDCIMVKRLFQSSVNIAKAFRLRFQRVKNQGSIRIRFSLEKLKDP